MAYLERTKITDDEGNVISGELIEAIEALRMAAQSLLRASGGAMPDTAGRLRVNVETGNIGTLTNQTQVGGFFATEQVPSLMRLGADSLRRNITVS